MSRTSSLLLGLALVAAAAGRAPAAPVSTGPAPGAPVIEGGPRAIVITPRTQFTPNTGMLSPYLYLNRCIGGCTVNGGTTNDARTQTSSIPSPGAHQIGEFANQFGQTSADGGTCLGDGATPCTTDADCAGMTPATCDTADYEWQQVVTCMKEVYSPFAITVQDTQPAGGVSYTEAIIAGNPDDIGLGPGILGIAPLAGDCSPQDNVISFSFANHHGANARALNICWTAAQETAHAFGLDHEYEFTDGTSACNDPMTYRTDCGGEKFFRNMPASCGENTVRECRCGGTQNSHLKILNVFGPGTSIVPPPTAAVATPADGATVSSGFVVHATAGSKRGVARVELWLNGYKWAEAPGASFGQIGQLDPSNYTLNVPSDVPDGVIDIEVKAFDDLGAEGDSQVVTVTKGQPCADASACAAGQKCDAGKCYWDPASGQLGDACEYPQFCESGVCQGTADQMICTQSCIVSSSGSCPEGYDCVQTSGTDGICFPPADGGGCCSVGGGGALGLQCGLACLVLGFVLRRRRAA